MTLVNPDGKRTNQKESCDRRRMKYDTSLSTGNFEREVCIYRGGQNTERRPEEGRE